MYFVWRSNAALSNTYMYVPQLPSDLRHKDWITGEPVTNDPKVATLTGKDDSPTTLSDVIVGGFNFPVLSPNAISVLETTGVDNIEYFPIKIKNWKTGELDKSYKIANIVGLVYCLDKEHATFRTFDDGEIRALQHYRILEDKILPKGRGKKAPLIFRLGEFRYHVLAHESVKTAFEKEKITGSEFIAPKEFA
jgi:uncharacterized protein DUF1629